MKEGALDRITRALKFHVPKGATTEVKISDEILKYREKIKRMGQLFERIKGEEEGFLGQG